MSSNRQAGGHPKEPGLEITQVRSANGSQRRQRATLHALGLRRVRHTVHHADRPEIRGMVAKVAHLVVVRYSDDEQVLVLAPGQEPKGPGNPPAGHTLADDEAATRSEQLTEALSEPGRASAASLVQNPPTLTSTDAPDAPKKPGAPVEETDEAADDAEQDTPAQGEL
ncbi:MAG: 50S ribosomal protein L30 [Euzebyales bacterium]|nr:50S ribosomal protein L30 [Euzebyales bacterium]MBA3621483.1 50S ribosomal protein L30 [Euzebyales bacterium]